MHFTYPGLNMVYAVPPSAELLKDCPQFENLQKKLNALLDRDGAISSELEHPRQTHLSNATEKLLRHSILKESTQILLTSDKLPHELRIMLAQTYIPPYVEISGPHSDTTSGSGPSIGQRTESIGPPRPPSKTCKTPRTAMKQELARMLNNFSRCSEPGSRKISISCKNRATHIEATHLELARIQVVLSSLSSELLEIADDVVKLLAIHLEYNRHGQSERSLRLYCDYLNAVAGGLQSKLRTTCASMQYSIYDHDALRLVQKLQHEIGLIQENLKARSVTLERSFTEYQQSGEDFERLLQEYLRAHVALVECEQAIDELSAAKASSNVRHFNA